MEINSGQLKKYISSSKSVNLMTDGCKLLPRVGRVQFDFSDFSGITNCKVRAKRLSGNGKIKLVIGNKSSNIIIASKSSFTFNIELGEDKLFEILRPPDSSGEISVISIAFDPNIKEAPMAINWKGLIRRCGKYKNLRLIKGRLFAGSGGFIERGEMVSEIETSPPNMFKYDGGKLIFINSCEVTNLVVGMGVKAKENLIKNLYVERQAPTKIEVAQNLVPKQATPKGQLPPIPRPIVDGTFSGLENQIIFDSNNINFTKTIIGKNKYVKPIKSLGKDYILLRQNGNFNIPISILEPNKNYICVFYAKKLNGNGKIRVGLSENDVINEFFGEVQFSKNINSKYVYLRTSNDVNQKIHLSMPPTSSNGEILINRIVILNDIDFKSDRYNYFPPVYAQTIKTPVSLINYNVTISESNDEQYISSKRFLRYSKPKQAVNADQMFNGNMSVSSLNSMMWFNEMKSFCPKIYIDDKNPDSGLSISEVGSIKKKNNIWLSVFNSISDTDLSILSKSKKVFSPSLSNYQELSKKLPNTKVELFKLPLPWIKPESQNIFNKFEFVVAFNRCSASTSRIIEAWSNDLPKLVLVGARGNYPDFVIPTNEYIKYSQLVNIISKAKCVIDLPMIRDYASSLLGLSLAVGTPVVSTNWFIFNEDNSVFLVGEDKVGNISIPSVDNMKKGLEKVFLLNKTQVSDSDLIDYSNTEIERFKRMF